MKDERGFPDFDQTLISEALCNPERGHAFDPAKTFSSLGVVCGWASFIIGLSSSMGVVCCLSLGVVRRYASFVVGHRPSLGVVRSLALLFEYDFNTILCLLFSGKRCGSGGFFFRFCFRFPVFLFAYIYGAFPSVVTSLLLLSCYYYTQSIFTSASSGPHYY